MIKGIVGGLTDKSYCRYRYLSNILKPQRGNDSVMDLIRSKIKLSGPLSVADYMKIVLTSQTGYYMVNDVFGKKGDFITSPEISQLFGEMVGVWAVNELFKLGSPKPLNIVELGPGRGTMIQDILRVLRKLGQTSHLSINLVELSPSLSRIQSERLCESSVAVDDERYYRRGVTVDKIQVYWYRSVMDLPKQAFTCLFANEFFDALPLHKFYKTVDGWREILIDLDEISGHSTLRYVVSKHPTPASILFNQEEKNRDGIQFSPQDHMEFCPEAGVIMHHLARMLEEHGGMALVVDYGHCGDKTDTFRAFKDHKLVDPLTNPGTADLTADVDFSYLKRCVENKLITFGPVKQADFLGKLHIETRLKVLVDSCKSDTDKKSLLSSFDMLMNQDEMGQRFKVMSFFPAVLLEFFKKFPVQGF